MIDFAGQVAFCSACMARDAAYQPRKPEENPLFEVISGHLETFRARQRQHDRHIPGFVEKEFREFIGCGALSRGFVRVHCDVCGLDLKRAFRDGTTHVVFQPLEMLEKLAALVPAPKSHLVTS